MGLTTLEQNSMEIFNAGGRRVSIYTPQLFTFKDEFQGTIRSHGSAVLIEHYGVYYMVTAFHCIDNDGTMGRVGVLNAAGHLKLISGPLNFVRGDYNEVDITFIRLLPESVETLLEKYSFLNMNKVYKTELIPELSDLAVFGHPISGTSIDTKKKRLKMKPFYHICKTETRDVYDNIWFKTDTQPRQKFKFDWHKSTLLRFNRRKSTYIGSGVMSMSQHPKGISGCGVWYFPDHRVADPNDAEFFLAGIITEYHPSQGYLVATNTEYIAYLLQDMLKRFPIR